MSKYILSDELVDKLYEQAEVKNKEIKRLRKENEWLIDNWALVRSPVWPTVKSQKETIIREMQQALNEGE